MLKKTKKTLSTCIQSLNKTIFVGIEESLTVGELSSWYFSFPLLFDMSLESSLGTIVRRVQTEHLKLRGLLANWRSMLISLPDKKDFTRNPQVAIKESSGADGVRTIVEKGMLPLLLLHLPKSLDSAHVFRLA